MVSDTARNRTRVSSPITSVFLLPHQPTSPHCRGIMKYLSLKSPSWASSDFSSVCDLIKMPEVREPRGPVTTPEQSRFSCPFLKSMIGLQTRRAMCRPEHRLHHPGFEAQMADRQQGVPGNLTRSEAAVSRWTEKSCEENHCSLDLLKMRPSRSLVNNFTDWEER